MLTFVIRRILALIPLLLIVSFIVFGLVYLVPGDAAATLAGGEDASPERIAQVREQLGLSDPFIEQYGRWLGRAARLDFGTSLFSTAKVKDDLRTRFPVTVQIAIGALIFGIVVGVPLGIIAGMRPRTFIDRAITAGTSLAIAIPSFWLALILVLNFAVYRNIFPTRGFVKFSEDPYEWFMHLVLPCAALGTLVAATLARTLRGALADVMATDHIRTAWSKGLPPLKVVGKHALKNAAVPAITVLGLQVAYLLGGTVIIESIFGIAGIGSYMVLAITRNDIPAVQGGVMFIALIVVFINFLVDISYAFVNPKVRVE